jgi:cysteine-rich CWC protein
MAMMDSSMIDESQCPLCGKANLCAVSNGKKGTSCWCQHEHIEPSLIAAVPEPLKGKSCICEACASKANQLARELR